MNRSEDNQMKSQSESDSPKQTDPIEQTLTETSTQSGTDCQEPRCGIPGCKCLNNYCGRKGEGSPGEFTYEMGYW